MRDSEDASMRMLPLLVVFAVLAAGIGYALAAETMPFPPKTFTVR